METDCRTDGLDGEFLKYLKNAELFRMKLKSFSLNTHCAPYMNVVIKFYCASYCVRTVLGNEGLVSDGNS